MGGSIDSATRFKLAIIQDSEFDKNEYCPHCEKGGVHDDTILTMVQTRELIADIMQCGNCKDPYMVVEYPRLTNPGPVFTTFNLR